MRPRGGGLTEPDDAVARARCLPVVESDNGIGSAGHRPPDLDALFLAEWAGVVRYLRRAARDDALAEDLAQETFLRAAQGLAGFRGESSPRTWLRRIAANVVRDHWRSRTARGEGPHQSGAPDDPQRLPDPGESPALAVERRQVQACLEDLVAQLPSGERDALILAAGHSLPPREVARRLRLAPDAARARLHRARRKLEALVAERCVLAADEGGALSCDPRWPRACSAAGPAPPIPPA